MINGLTGQYDQHSFELEIYDQWFDQRLLKDHRSIRFQSTGNQTDQSDESELSCSDQYDQKLESEVFDQWFDH
jgi:hypothetical protein